MKTYVVLFGNARYNPWNYTNACNHRFDTLKEARAYARRYSNSAVYRVLDCGAVKEMKLYYTKRV